MYGVICIGTLKAKKLAARNADSLQCESGLSMGAAAAQADTMSGKGTRNLNFLLNLNRTEEKVEKGTTLSVRWE